MIEVGSTIKNKGKRICAYFLVCIYLYCHGRSNYQEREGWNPINLFNPAAILCMSQDRAGITNIICCGFFFVLNGLR